MYAMAPGSTISDPLITPLKLNSMPLLTTTFPFTTPRIVTSELTVRSPLSTADRSKGRAEAEAALAG